MALLSLDSYADSIGLRRKWDLLRGGEMGSK